MKILRPVMRPVLRQTLLLFALLLQLAGGALSPACAATDPVAQGIAAANSQALGGLTLGLGERLRRAARAAQASNPVDNLPWTIAPAWTASTAYLQGAVVSASVTASSITHTAYYVQLGTAGTSGSTAPTWRLDGITVSDNGLLWMYVGDRPMAANDANAPTITLTTEPNNYTNPITGNTSGQYIVYAGSNYFSRAFTLAGATNVNTGPGWGSTFVGYNSASGVAGTAKGIDISFQVDDIAFSIGTQTGWQRMGIIIDGRFVAPQWLQQATTGNTNWVTFTFAARRTHTVEIVTGSAGFTFLGVALPGPSTVRALPPKTVTAVAVDDSYDDGSSYHPFLAFGQLNTQVGLRLGWNVTHMATGGTGFANPNGSNYTFPQRVADSANAAIIAKADVVFGHGSTNDSGYTSAQIQAGVNAFYANIRAVNPTCAIIWFGPAPIGTSLSALQSYQAVDTAEATAWAAIMANDKRVFYHPWANAPLSTTPFMNVYQTGYYANTIGVYINGGDSIHPTDLGLNAESKWEADTIVNNDLPQL
jgi:hypothetical protein